MGFDWFVFRVKYELLKKVGYFDWYNQVVLQKVKALDSDLLFYKNSGLINRAFKGSRVFIQKADYAMEGKIFGFSNEYLEYGDKGEIEWHMNPVTKIKADNTESWNKLPDFGPYGDIKLIWEASRFPHIYYFINAYSITGDEKYAKICIRQMVDWVKSNPYPNGVHYKCGQEISFRLFAWIIALEYFEKSLRPEDEKVIVKNIYTSLLRVDVNIDYAAKSVKNNQGKISYALLYWIYRVSIRLSTNPSYNVSLIFSIVPLNIDCTERVQ